MCFPSQRARQRLLSTTDELKMSSRRITVGGLAVAPAGSPLCLVSTQAPALCLLAGARYSSPGLAVALTTLLLEFRKRL